MRSKISLIFLLVSMVTISFAWAGEEKSIEIEKIVITPTRISETIRELPFSVSVISKEEIEASLANSATDILNILPGVFVHKTGDFGRAEVEIRGHGSRGRRIMVLVDGKPEKMGLFACTITHSLPLDNVERIEVIRGPAAVLYGSDALSGVINIITKKATKKLEGDATISYGSFDTQVYRLRQGQDLGKFNYYFTVDERKSRGHLPNSDYDHRNFTLRLGADLTEELVAVFTTRYFDGFKREPRPAPVDTWNDYERGAFDLTLDGKWDVLDGMLKVYRNFGEHQFKDGWHSKDYTNGAMLQANLSPFEGNTLSAGAEFREQGGKVLGGPPAVIKGKYDKDEYAIFLQDKQKFFNEKLIASAGIRYNDDELAGDILCPSFGLTFQLTDITTLRTSVSKGFRAPALNELRFALPANPDLKPEKSWNYEAGFNQKLTDRLNLDFTYFVMEVEDFIRRAPPFPPGRFRNIDELEFRGIETSLEYQIFKELSSRLSYTYLDSGRFTQGRPENELDISLLFKKERLGFSLVGQYVDNYFAKDDKKEAIPNFFLVDTKMTYNIFKSFEVYLGIENLFNVEHKIFVDLPGGEAGVYTQPGRTFTLGATYKW